MENSLSGFNQDVCQSSSLNHIIRAPGFNCSISLWMHPNFSLLGEVEVKGRSREGVTFRVT
jgi:hypothetical protein